jgi:hypothetical protein
LPSDQPVEVGKTDTHVVFRIGDWTIWCEIQTEARFPDVQRAIPGDAEITARLRLDPQDARFLDLALGRLPEAEDDNSPVTIDLNGRVAIRAVPSDQPQQVTELVLSRSNCTGPPLSVAINRTFLDRALRLGFIEIGFTGAESPYVCRDQRMTYAVQSLTGSSPLKPEDTVTRIESSPAAGRADRAQTHSETPRRSTNESVRRNGREPARSVEANGRHSAKSVETNGQVPTRSAEVNAVPVSESPGTSLAALIQEAESLHAALADAKSRSARLISGLGRQRKQSRLLAETLKSLRQLRLVEAAE